MELTVLYQENAGDYPALNSATVDCPWCIVDLAQDVEAEPTAAAGVSNFSLHYAGGVLVSWETLSELDILGFNLYRASGLEETTMLYQTGAAHPFQLAGGQYAFMDRTAQPGVLYEYRLQVVWHDGSVSQAAAAQIVGPYQASLPLILRSARGR